MDTFIKALNNGWKFHYGDCPDAWQKSFEDSTWEEVSIPHDWAVTMPFSRNCSSGTGYLPGGTGWYRTSFTLPKDYQGKRIYIVFDGIYKNSQVWCNGYYKGKYPYGYTTFAYDLTDNIHFDGTDNTLCIKVTHEDISDSRWYTGSGITRKVRLIITEQIHPLFQGIFFTTPEVSKEQASAEIFNEIQNSSSQTAAVTVRSSLFLDDLKAFSVCSETQSLKPGELRKIITKGDIHSPMLWSVEQPSLYRLETGITVKYEGSGEEVSWTADTCYVGIRSFCFDPDTGFSLNEKPMKLKGVCVHHDAGALGAAVPACVWARRLTKLKEAGCNAIRMSHNPHSPEIYSLCDEMGFLVIDEAFDEWEGCKNKWSTGHNVYPPKHQGYAEEFPIWHEKDLKAMVRRDRNHPSVILWSIGNEIDYPNDPYCHPLFQSMTGNNDANKPEAERLYRNDRPNAERLTTLAKELAALIKEEDITRPVTAAAAFPELSAQIGFIDPLDVVGYNYKEHLYEEDHLRFPGKPFIGSENWHSYKAWLAVKDNDYISGQFLWTGIDYLGEAHGWPIHGSGAGLLTTAGFEKAGYYRRKSFWREDPVIELTVSYSNRNEFSTGRRWNHMLRSWNFAAGEMVDVHCYTNCEAVQLYCNDTCYGHGEMDLESGAINWTIPYEAGCLYAVAADGSEMRGELNTSKSASRIRLTPWICGEFATLPDDDVVQIEVGITDEDGKSVPGDCSSIYITVEGEGRLIGVDNGDLADNRDLWTNYCHVYDGKAMIYALKNSSESKITISVFSDYLISAIIEV